MIAEYRADYPSVTGGGEAVANQLGIGKETVRRWFVQADIEAGDRPGTSNEENRRGPAGPGHGPTVRSRTGGWWHLPWTTAFLYGLLHIATRKQW